MTVMVRRTDLSADELRSLARRARDVAQARRLLAVASVLEGASRTQAAEAAGMMRQTLRDWVHRYNEEGQTGSSTGGVRDVRAGSARHNSRNSMRLSKKAPTLPSTAWCAGAASTFRASSRRRSRGTMSERHVGRMLRKRGFTRLSARPHHPKTDEAAQEAFKKTSPR